MIPQATEDAQGITLDHGLLCWKNTSYISQTEILLFQEATQWLFFTWPLLEEFKDLQPPLTGHCADFSACSHHGNSKITQVCIRWSEAFQSRLCKPAPGYILIIWGLSGNIEITDILKNTSETNKVLYISNWEEPTWLGGDSSSKRLYAAASQDFSKSNDFLACNILQTEAKENLPFLFKYKITQWYPVIENWSSYLTLCRGSTARMSGFTAGHRNCDLQQTAVTTTSVK